MQREEQRGNEGGREKNVAPVDDGSSYSTGSIRHPVRSASGQRWPRVAIVHMPTDTRTCRARAGCAAEYADERKELVQVFPGILASPRHHVRDGVDKRQHVRPFARSVARKGPNSLAGCFFADVTGSAKLDPDAAARPRASPYMPRSPAALAEQAGQDRRPVGRQNVDPSSAAPKTQPVGEQPALCPPEQPALHSASRSRPGQMRVADPGEPPTVSGSHCKRKAVQFVCDARRAVGCGKPSTRERAGRNTHADD